MNIIKVILLTTLFFIMGYMIQFVDYTFRFFTQNSILYNLVIILFLGVIIFFTSKQLKVKDLDFNFYSLKMLFTMLLVAAALLVFYPQYVDIINQIPILILIYLMFSFIVIYLYTTIISKLSLKEKFVFIGYVLLIILINFLVELFNDTFDFQLLVWLLYAISTSIFVLLYYVIASFVITKERLKLTYLAINMISILLLARAIFVIIILLAPSK